MYVFHPPKKNRKKKGNNNNNKKEGHPVTAVQAKKAEL